MQVIRILADRTVVLFLGVAVGTAMGYSFAGDIARRTAPPPVAPVALPPDIGQGDTGPAQGAAPHSGRGRDTRTQLPAQAAVRIEDHGPVSQHLLDTLKAGAKIRVGVFGDSFGDGVWAALYHQLRAKDGYEVLKFSQQATGFTRYRQLNLEDKAASDLADRPIDIAVISFGANDTQPTMHNGHFAPLLSPAWQEEIAGKVERYVALLRRHGAIVYWVGLPKMRKDSFDSDISGMNAFYAALMARLGVPFIDTKPLSVDANGNYAAYLPDPVTHEPRLMRANDGIHMSMHGYERLTEQLSQRIKAYVARIGDAQRSGTAVAVGVASPIPPEPAPARKPDSAPKPKGDDASSKQARIPTVTPPKPKTLDDVVKAIDEANDDDAASNGADNRPARSDQSHRPAANDSRPGAPRD